ncbi:MAG: 4-(cytidine 5'-diphospho)-2-C-methyl-D-erythritol kinase [Alphaproteobacteria bacterium]|nr:4-(cytidine 5'-diphospho)-2-C-methyl-D-erythritol kinase [Alphaproteobacteria bacterium]MBU2271444.1 4-(cytidine 5'-diphospho)-2-C-methyl-D-erythritol kinase [Alphaproteobacteria bacterium]MBU2417095.1 4-(cytidine 5'-diphospho)-2-C-methyl-D-erythritol kinase [Alphaproteobacteria bacterium]
MEPRSALAPAKVNLFLHVGPVDEAGYHPLASLVAFADVGDRIEVAPSDRLSLTVEGPFAGALDGPGDNLILRALRALGQAAGLDEPPVAVTLDKRLPIAAGLGGGSSDAGTALRLTRDLLALDLDDDALADIAMTVGADGPMCLHARTAWAEGRGEILTPEPRLPSLPALMVNPGVASPTGEVYRAFDDGPPSRADRPAPPAGWDAAAVIDWLTGQRNDLQPPAVARVPAIARALDAATILPDVRLVRMSGSGATVFALFDTPAAAASAGRRLAADYPGWWITATNLA